MAEVITVMGKESTLSRGVAVYSATAEKMLTLDLPPDVYFPGLFYRSRLVDASFGFRLEIVE